MISLHTITITATLATLGVTGCTLTPYTEDTQVSGAASTGNMSMPMSGFDAQMARMDEQIEAMQSMHDKMEKTKTPEERDAMMVEHMGVMQNSMAMMGESDASRMMEKGSMGEMKHQSTIAEDLVGMAGMQDRVTIDGDMSVQRQMTEKRMQMMQSMMQMMMDQMATDSDKS